MMRSVLYYTNTLNWILIVLSHWNNSPQTDMSLHLDALSDWNNSPQTDMSLHLDSLSDWNKSPLIDMSAHSDSLSHWNNRPQIDMSPHSDSLWANPCLLLLLKCCMFSGEATNTNFIVFDLTRSGFEPLHFHDYIYHPSTEEAFIQ
jgi:hypothetical protein